jgi:hypothetical protein
MPPAPGPAASAASDRPARSVPIRSATADSTSPALTVQTSGRKRPVASAKPATAPEASAAGTAVTANAVPEVPIDTATSPGRRPSPSAAPMLSPVPAATTAPHAVSPTASAGRATLGSSAAWPSAADTTSGSHCPAASEKYPVPEASPRSVTMSGGCPGPARGPLSGCPAARSRSPRAPRSRQVSQSWGSMTATVAAACCGSCSASQRSLVTVKEAVGTLPVWVAHQSGPPRSRISAAAAEADRRSFQSRAGLITSPPESSTTMPCCWPATPTAAACSSRPSPALASAAHHAAGSVSVPSGWGTLPRPMTVPSSARHSRTLVDCVEESTPATSMLPPC